MLLNLVSTLTLTVMLSFLSTPTLKADTCPLDDNSFETTISDKTQADTSNVLVEDQDDMFDDEDNKTPAEHLYSLGDDDDDFD